MSAPSFIYVLIEASALRSASTTGVYLPPKFHDEGFIHASTRDQILKSANQFFGAAMELMVLEIDTSVLSSPLLFEPGRSGTLYPHIYGPLTLGEVSRAMPIAKDDSGCFVLPQDLRDA